MTKKFQTTKVYVIRQASTGQCIRFGSKCAWATTGAAKNAFSLHMHSYFGLIYTDSGVGLFDSQKDFYLDEVC